MLCSKISEVTKVGKHIELFWVKRNFKFINQVYCANVFVIKIIEQFCIYHLKMMLQVQFQVNRQFSRSFSDTSINCSAANSIVSFINRKNQFIGARLCKTFEMCKLLQIEWILFDFVVVFRYRACIRSWKIWALGQVIVEIFLINSVHVIAATNLRECKYTLVFIILIHFEHLDWNLQMRIEANLKFNDTSNRKMNFGWILLKIQFVIPCASCRILFSN